MVQTPREAITLVAFEAALSDWGVTKRQFAALAGVHWLTVKRWGVDRDVPSWVGLVMDLRREADKMTRFSKHLQTKLKERRG